MNFFLDSSESGVSSISSSPRSIKSAREDVEYSLEEIDSSYGLPPSPESFPVRSAAIRESEPPKWNKCRRHDEPIRFYCIDCCVKICGDCRLTYHEFCYTELLRSFAVKLYKTSLESDAFRFSATKENLQNIRASFDSKVNDIKKKVDVMADAIIEEIERKRRDIKKKLRIIELDRHHTWMYQMELCQRSINRLKSQFKGVKKLDLEDINVMRKNISVQLGSGLDFIDDGKIDVHFKDVPVFEFGNIKLPPCPTKSTVKLPQNSFSDRYNTCTVVIRNILKELADGDYSITAYMHDADFNSVYLTIKNEQNGTYKISYYPTRLGVHLLYVHLDITPIGKSPYRLNVAYEESEHIPRCCFAIDGGDRQKLSRPWGICADFRGRILVADRGNNCVKIFTEKGAYVGGFGETGSGPGEFLRPTGIAVDHVLQRIVVCDKDNHRIQVFTINGFYILEFGSQGEKNGQFTYPWDVSVSESSLIAVSDSKNRRIQLFDQRGKFIRKFSFNLRAMPNIELPRGLMFRVDGSLMVTDFNKHKIITLDESFESPKEFGEEGSELAQFFRPQSIDIDRTGKFAVSDCKNHRIQVFKPSGELFCVFGSQGDKIGELESPQGVCFLSNGCIAVAELNNRIQVFKIPEEAN